MTYEHSRMRQQEEEKIDRLVNQSTDIQFVLLFCGSSMSLVSKWYLYGDGISSGEGNGKQIL